MQNAGAVTAVVRARERKKQKETTWGDKWKRKSAIVTSAIGNLQSGENKYVKPGTGAPTATQTRTFSERPKEGRLSETYRVDRKCYPT